MKMAKPTNAPLPGSLRAKFVGGASLLFSAALLSLPWMFKLDGKQHSDWQQFLGRFHPSVVHLPIGLILLVPLLEVAGLVRPALREAAAFVLNLSVFACLSAVALGYLLAYGGGESGTGVVRHMWGGLALTVGVLFCALIRSASARPRGIYPAMLIALSLLLSWTAHQGGSLTHGSDYLTRYLPVWIRRFSRMQTAPAKALMAPDSFYAKHIDPVLDAKCVACHGPSKVKGDLRLDSYEGLMRGGEDGAVVLAGEPGRSLLVQRVTLPADHEHFMPAEGKVPLKPEEIVWIKAWIAQGASPTIASLKGFSFPDDVQQDPLPQVGDYSALASQIAALEQSTGARLTPVSRKPADGLILNATGVTSTFNDAQLSQFAKFAPYIVEAELGRTMVSDTSFETLAQFTNLHALHLEGTTVSGKGLQKLTQLPHLAYLNLSGTLVTKVTIAPLTSMKHLRRLYLYNTPAQPGARSAETPVSVKASS